MSKGMTVFLVLASVALPLLIGVAALAVGIARHDQYRFWLGGFAVCYAALSGWIISGAKRRRA